MAGSTTGRTVAIKKWRSKNPLRVWARQQPGSGLVSWLAKRMDVSRTMVYFWMDGIQYPAPARFVSIELLTREEVNKTVWDKWLLGKPT